MLFFAPAVHLKWWGGCVRGLHLVLVHVKRRGGGPPHVSLAQVHFLHTVSRASKMQFMTLRESSLQSQWTTVSLRRAQYPEALRRCGGTDGGASGLLSETLVGGNAPKDDAYGEKRSKSGVNHAPPFVWFTPLLLLFSAPHDEQRKI